MALSDAPTLNDLLAASPKADGFSPHCWYSSAGDCIICVDEPGDYFRERINNLVTVYRAISDQHIIGVQVKSLRAFASHALVAEMYQRRRVNMAALLTLSFLDPSAYRKARLPRFLGWQPSPKPVPTNHATIYCQLLEEFGDKNVSLEPNEVLC